MTGKDGGTIVSWGDDSTGQACVPLGVTTAIQVSAANNAPNGNGDRLLDLLAPGYYVLSSVPNSTTNWYEPTGYTYNAGTSMATLHGAGAWTVTLYLTQCQCESDS